MNAFNDDKERVRDAADIVRVIGDHVSLKPHGREYLGICPFHDDHKPSMNVVPHKQIFHCFSCGAGGDVFSFVQRYHAMDFREALNHLAERFGVTLTPRGQNTPASDDSQPHISRKDLLNANATATEFFKTILRNEQHGATARQLIADRGINEQMVEAFALGASPDRWDGLIKTLQGKSMDEAPFVQAGLLKPKDSGEFYDVLRNRLIFPIHDQIGRVIAFGGRRINDEDDPKYLNSPETPLFNKSATLYGIHQAARRIQAERTAIVTEGYTDVIACHQAGFTNVVATLGTALTPGHAAILRRLCDTIVLLFDSDEAGSRAADRAVEVFFAEPVDVKIATLASVTDAKDPDELLKRQDGQALFPQAIQNAVDLLSFRFGRIADSLQEAGPAAMSRAIEQELASLVQLGLNTLQPLRRALVVRQLSQIARVDEQIIIRAIPAGRKPRHWPSEDSQEQTADQSPPENLDSVQALLLGCILCEPALLVSLDEHQRERVAPDAYPSGVLRRLTVAIGQVVASGHEPDLHAVLGAIDADDLQTNQTAVALYTHTNTITDSEQPRLHQLWRDCLQRADKTHIPDQTQNDVNERVERIRQNHAACGGDRRILPRPAVMR